MKACSFLKLGLKCKWFVGQSSNIHHNNCRMNVETWPWVTVSLVFGVYLCTQPSQPVRQFTLLEILIILSYLWIHWLFRYSVVNIKLDKDSKASISSCCWAILHNLAWLGPVIKVKQIPCAVMSFSLFSLNFKYKLLVVICVAESDHTYHQKNIGGKPWPYCDVIVWHSYSQFFLVLVL